jgi:short-subunit dehydrogenase
VADQVRKDFSRIDILVNNAGIVVGKPAAEVSYAEMRRTVDINLLGVMWMTRQFLGDMMSANSGHIVNIASAGGLLAVPRLADYCATKFAVVGYSDALRMEMKKFGCPGVKISCICPSVIDTGMFKGFTPPLLNPLLDPADGRPADRSNGQTGKGLFEDSLHGQDDSLFQTAAGVLGGPAGGPDRHQPGHGSFRGTLTVPNVPIVAEQ